MTFVPEVTPAMPSFSASARGSTTNPQFTDRALVVSRPLTAHPNGSRLDGESDQFVVVHTLRAEGADAGEDGTGRGTPLVVSPTLGGGNYGAGNLAEGVPNVVVASGPATDNIKGGGGVGVRRLTPLLLECERLQGFPDGWTEGYADSVRYRMLDNAVAVSVASWVLRRVAEREQP